MHPAQSNAATTATATTTATTTTATTATTTTADGWTQRRRRISAHLERTALRLFAERGYPLVTLQDVAGEAGVSPRTLTRYFPTKEDLLLSQPRRSAEAALAALAEQPRDAKALPHLWDTWIGLAGQAREEDLAELRLWFRAVRTAPRAYAHGGAQMRQLIGDSLTSVAARSLGVPTDDVRARVVAAALTAVQDAVLEQWLEGDGTASLAELFLAARAGLSQAFAPARVDRAPRRSSYS